MKLLKYRVQDLKAKLAEHDFTLDRTGTGYRFKDAGGSVLRNKMNIDQAEDYASIGEFTKPTKKANVENAKHFSDWCKLRKSRCSAVAAMTGSSRFSLNNVVQGVDGLSDKVFSRCLFAMSLIEMEEEKNKLHVFKIIQNAAVQYDDGDFFQKELERWVTKLVELR